MYDPGEWPHVLVWTGTCQDLVQSPTFVVGRLLYQSILAWMFDSAGMRALSRYRNSMSILPTVEWDGFCNSCTCLLRLLMSQRQGPELVYGVFPLGVEKTVVSPCCWDVVVCRLDSQWDCLVTWVTGLSDMSKDGHHELCTSNELVEKHHIHYEVFPPIFLRDDKEVSEEPFVYWT